MSDPTARPAAAVAAQKRIVVIVDESLANSLILKTYVEKIGGVEPLVFADPTEALGWCRKHQPDLILVGYVMPKMNGLAFVETIRSMPHYDEIPVVMIASLEQKEVLYRALELGVNDFLNKLVDEIELTARARTMLKLRARSLALADANRQLQRFATTDVLTGIDNRRSFLGRATEEFERSRRYGKALSTVMVDADLFKSVNDTYGNPGGDAVLTKIAATCRSVIRNVDCVGRLGGEEFALFLPETAVSSAVSVAERLRMQIAAEPILFAGQTIPATVSIGVAERRDDDRDFADMLARADQALYLAKQDGRNCIRQS